MVLINKLLALAKQSHARYAYIKCQTDNKMYFFLFIFLCFFLFNLFTVSLSISGGDEASRRGWVLSIRRNATAKLRYDELE